MSPRAAALLCALLFVAGRGGGGTVTGPVGRGGGSGTGPVRRGCDNGKLHLQTDLPPSSMWRCPGPPWPESTQNFPGIDTHYHPQTAQQVCMDTHISYNHSIPHSGASRPVGGESGEYLYCPPQRWVNNLQHGATVMLYHPCAPGRPRVRLSVLFRSCLSSYVITPHPELSSTTPFALVSWGRTLELAGAPSTEVCDWLEETAAAAAGGYRGDHASVHGRYSLLLTRPAEEPPRRRAGRTLTHCCRKILSDGENQGERERRGRETEEERRGRAAGEEGEERGSRTMDFLGSVTPGWVNRTVPGSTEPTGETQNPGPAPGPTPLGPAPLGHAPLGHAPPTRTVWAPDGAEGRGGAGPSAADASPVDVREREVDRHGQQATPPTEGKGAESEHRQGGGGGGRGGGGGVTQGPEGVAAGGRRPTARTEEAVWAAASLGFLLVLLALAVLHTRLYRHWTTAPSLYWRDTTQDYDSVADVIRMRLRAAADHRRKRRKRRASLSRREECSLLPSSSEEDDL